MLELCSFREKLGQSKSTLDFSVDPVFDNRSMSVIKRTEIGRRFSELLVGCKQSIRVREDVKKCQSLHEFILYGIIERRVFFCYFSDL